MDIPNNGVTFCLGSYKVELTINTGYGRQRSLVIECDGQYGVYVDKLIDQLQVDIENLRQTVNRCVADAKKEWMEKS